GTKRAEQRQARDDGVGRLEAGHEQVAAERLRVAPVAPHACEREGATIRWHVHVLDSHRADRLGCRAAAAREVVEVGGEPEDLPAGGRERLRESRIAHGPEARAGNRVEGIDEPHAGRTSVLGHATTASRRRHTAAYARASRTPTAS